MGKNLMTPIGRAAYPCLVKPREEDSGALKFSQMIVFSEDTSLAQLEAAVEEVLKDEFERQNKKRPPNLKLPFRSGATMTDSNGELREGFAETDIVINAKRNADFGPPPCCDQKRNDILATDIYAGCRVRLLVSPFYYDTKGNRGVAFGLEAVQFAGDGERIGMAPVDCKDAFDDIDEDVASALE